MSSAFSPLIEEALDRYDVPALPEGFADRVVARANSETAISAQPATRRRSNGPWRRTSRIVGSIGVFSLFSATAAAMGFFGEPVDIPIISDVAVELNLIPRPISVVSAAPSNLSKTDNTAINATLEDDQTAKPAASDTKRALQQIVDDPRFAKLTPRQKRIIVRRQSRNMVRSGTASPIEVRSAIREIRQEKIAGARETTPADHPVADNLRERIANATPEQKARMRENFENLPPERQEAIRERIENARAINADTRTAQNTSADSLAAPGQNSVAPVEDSAQSIVSPSTTMESRPAIDQLRERYREATPEQRAIWREKNQLRRKPTLPRNNQPRDRAAPPRRPQH